MNNIFVSGPFKYNKLETKKYGLLFEPSLVELDNNQDSPVGFPEINYHFDKDSVDIFKNIFMSIREKAKYIIEIGVDAYHNTNITMQSSTSIICNNKKDNTIYVGIDIEDKSRLNNLEKNIFTIASDSADINTVQSYFDKIGVKEKEVDFIFIDGWHSVNQVLIEWEYVEKYLSKDGVVVFHDTNYHPGSRLLFDAIDPNIFKITKYFENEANWGLGEIRYK